MFKSNMFPQQQQNTSLFGSSSTFGQQNKPTFGFGSAATQPGIFGQQSQIQPTGSLFQSDTPNLLSSTTPYAAQQSSGTVVKYAPVTGIDRIHENPYTQIINTKYHCITCMKEYENKSPEELRFEDYLQNRKGPQQQFGFFSPGKPNVGPSFFAPSTSGFSQSNSIGQPSTGFGLPNTGVGSSSIFGKPTGFGTSNNTPNTFGFNPTPAVPNFFNSQQQNKPFSSQPLFNPAATQNQPTGFGQNTQQQNQSRSLFPKPAQITNAFNTEQSGYLTSSFQPPKPNLGLNLFGQPNTKTSGTTTICGSKPTTFIFGQQIQPPTGFAGTNIGVLQQPTIHGTSTIGKPPTLFSSGNSTSLFSNNVCQQSSVSFPLQNVVPQSQQIQIPEISQDLKTLDALLTYPYPDGPHSFDYESTLLPKTYGTVINPLELRKHVELSKKQETSVHSKEKIPLLPPKRRNELIPEKQTLLLLNRRCLLIKKKNDDDISTSFYRKHTFDILEDLAEEGEKAKVLVSNDTKDDSAIMTENVENDENKTFLSLNSSISSVRFTDTLPSSTLTVNTNQLEDSNDNDSSSLDSQTGENSANPAGITLKRPEYYMYPAIEDLSQYINENGRCIVPELTIGRKGYGNVYYPNPIDITNMNFDEMIYFRHRELIICSDNCHKLPFGEDLNRRLQVTLDRIYPRVKGSNEYITDVDKILESDFVDNLRIVTQKHNYKFVEYRPNTGSWVFKVKDFCSNSFTDSDEEDCAIGTTKSKEVSVEKFSIACKEFGTQSEQMDELNIPSNQSLGEGYNKQYTESILESPPSSEFWRNLDSRALKEKELEKRALIQNLKASLFTNEVREMDTATKVGPVDVLKPYEPEIDVYRFPRIHTINLKPTITPEIAIRCYSDLGLFKAKGYKVGWVAGRKFFQCHETNLGIKTVRRLTMFEIKKSTPEFDIMMPAIRACLKICLEESKIKYREKILPQLFIKHDSSFLKRLQLLFMNHVKSHNLMGTGEYLSSVLCLIDALWGDKADNHYERRNNFSEWLKKFTLKKSLNIYKTPNTTEEALQVIFELMTCFQIDEAAHLAMKFSMPILALLISQVSLNDRCRNSLKILTELYEWESGLVPKFYKKIYMLLAGIAIKKEHDIWENLDWMRSLGVHLWYLTQSNVPIDVAIETYTETFQTDKNVHSPKPPYNVDAETDRYDILYHILMMYTQKYYKLSDMLDPLTHTRNFVDYRFSWILMQVFSSLSLGNITKQEKNLMHTTFANQLEQIGYWQWAIFVLLYLENDALKEYLIKRILERSIPTNSSPEIEEFIVGVLGIPYEWINEINVIHARIINYNNFEKIIDCRLFSNL